MFCNFISFVYFFFFFLISSFFLVCICVYSLSSDFLLNRRYGRVSSHASMFSVSAASARETRGVFVDSYQRMNFSDLAESEREKAEIASLFTNIPLAETYREDRRRSSIRSVSPSISAFGQATSNATSTADDQKATKKKENAKREDTSTQAAPPDAYDSAWESTKTLLTNVSSNL